MKNLKLIQNVIKLFQGFWHILIYSIVLPGPKILLADKLTERLRNNLLFLHLPVAYKKWKKKKKKERKKKEHDFYKPEKGTLSFFILFYVWFLHFEFIHFQNWFLFHLSASVSASELELVFDDDDVLTP